MWGRFWGGEKSALLRRVRGSFQFLSPVSLHRILVCKQCSKLDGEETVRPQGLLWFPCTRQEGSSAWAAPVTGKSTGGLALALRFHKGAQMCSRSSRAWHLALICDLSQGYFQKSSGNLKPRGVNEDGTGWWAWVNLTTLPVSPSAPLICNTAARGILYLCQLVSSLYLKPSPELLSLPSPGPQCIPKALRAWSPWPPILFQSPPHAAPATIFWVTPDLH